MRTSALAALLAALLVAHAVSAPQKKKKDKEEPVTQVLELPKELPGVIVADADRLEFHVTPLTARGLLTQQIRDTLKNLFREARGGTVVKLRAFVAGSGDMRRVQTIVSETLPRSGCRCRW